MGSETRAVFNPLCGVPQGSECEKINFFSHYEALDKRRQWGVTGPYPHPQGSPNIGFVDKVEGLFTAMSATEKS